MKLYTQTISAWVEGRACTFDDDTIIDVDSTVRQYLDIAPIALDKLQHAVDYVRYFVGGIFPPLTQQAQKRNLIKFQIEIKSLENYKRKKK